MATLDVFQATTALMCLRPIMQGMCSTYGLVLLVASKWQSYYVAVYPSLSTWISQSIHMTVYPCLLGKVSSKCWAFGELKKCHKIISIWKRLREDWILISNHVFSLEIIDDVTNLLENTDDKLRNQTRRVKMVDKKSTSCGKRLFDKKFLLTCFKVALIL